MKKICKTICIFMIILIMFSAIYKVNASDIWEVGRDFLETGSKVEGMTEENKDIFEALGVDTKAGFEELIDFLWSLGLLTIFISTIILGVKYMLVSPAEKSKMKQATAPYIIGVVIIFGALTIWKFIIVVLDGSL